MINSRCWVQYLDSLRLSTTSHNAIIYKYLSQVARQRKTGIKTRCNDVRKQEGKVFRRGIQVGSVFTVCTYELNEPCRKSSPVYRRRKVRKLPIIRATYPSIHRYCRHRRPMVVTLPGLLAGIAYALSPS